MFLIHLKKNMNNSVYIFLSKLNIKEYYISWNFIKKLPNIYEYYNK